YHPPCATPIAPNDPAQPPGPLGRRNVSDSRNAAPVRRSASFGVVCFRYALGGKTGPGPLPLLSELIRCVVATLEPQGHGDADLVRPNRCASPGLPAALIRPGKPPRAAELRRRGWAIDRI